MNAKEEIIRMLKQKLSQYDSRFDITDCGGEVIKLHNLITATEAAIFDVPSEDEIERKNIHQCDYCATLFKCDYCAIGFKEGIDFILNYKKPEPDGK